jgi:hypothetical protein
MRASNKKAVKCKAMPEAHLLVLDAANLESALQCMCSSDGLAGGRWMTRQAGYG